MQGQRTVGFHDVRDDPVLEIGQQVAKGAKLAQTGQFGNEITMLLAMHDDGWTDAELLAEAASQNSPEYADLLALMKLSQGGKKAMFKKALTRRLAGR